ncbi:hypothetical protein I4U23_003695 [Adineta vaga]|nr:hypothetical protein I4U23_003695 [Adineta vaga]
MSSVGSPSSSFLSERYVKNHSTTHEDDKDNHIALLLLILGICIPCIWILNWIICRNSSNKSARQYAKNSGILQLIEIGIFIVGTIIFFAGEAILVKNLTSSKTTEEDNS